ncbi:MAG: hypothetical protein R3324_13945 [Halobacteriales archaeon]|nr:hypothetical protein [Halobacteriales archaeon]
MSEFVPASAERINVFHVGEAFLFKHYFDDDEIFDELREYYNHSQYRFEIPAPDFERIRLFLEDREYGLVVVDDIEPFSVVVRKYTAHPENIFKGSVLHRSVGDYNLFVMTDREAMADAVEAGATPLEDSSVESPI